MVILAGLFDLAIIVVVCGFLAVMFVMEEVIQDLLRGDE